MTDRTMRQVAPYPHALAELVDQLTYRDWSIKLIDDCDREQGSRGMTLDIVVVVQDSLAPRETYSPIRVRHTFIVPAASYNRASWQRWLLDRVLDVETHEACEFFKIAGERVFAPHHSEGEDPYTIWMIGDRETAKKTSREK